ncbi:hypothetical protein PCANC_15182 [Puccinia coronata f. sp. avenae]|uniref:BZIP domain-containing protein n=1 Tax=Puccinia coronata f. sp. avenae TaxID=200324 RepID=A0A2N5SMA5_9BASI|nr:hypothetical protein PCANC_24281 [Puccinia coronata f. sp. avenae]PLW14363.1 hypothetical protein PCASD_19386 [Puccinia coronata f. sp. avenae]PLW37898.1 hypothetical protein PCANC_15182 [Puccinia coronata f. sp. avenae]PLW42922.1 hypothetical protein PCASD_04680 [Puccinia coronata f. sp. avenae]
MKRGRKQDDTLPPSRSREIQRAFRQRRSDYIKGLEARVSQLEAEVDDILARHNEPLRYTATEVLAARSVSRKKPRNKPKQNLSPFIEVNQPVEPYVHSPTDSMAMRPEDSFGISSSVKPNQSIGINLSSAEPVQYIITRDMNSEPNQHDFPPFPFGGHVDHHQLEYTRRDDDSASILARRNQRLLHLWNGVSKSGSLNCSSPESPGPPSSQFSQPLSANESEFQCSNSQMEMLMGIDSMAQSPVVSPQLMSSFDIHPEVRVAPLSACSLPSLVTDSSPRADQLSNMAFNSYSSSSDADLSPYTFRPHHSQIADRMDPCYTFIDSPNDSSSNVSGYRQESPLHLFQPKPLPGQHTLTNESLSTLVAIAATRLDHFEPTQSECSYQTPGLQPSPAP